ncbi:MAG TPA: hypothetical protein VGK46_04475, partial [Saprospiraceae bacterium]
MKIAVIVPSLHDVAPVQVAMAVATQLVQKGHTVTIYYFKASSAKRDIKEVTFHKVNFFGRIDWNAYDI